MRCAAANIDNSEIENIRFKDNSRTWYRGFADEEERDDSFDSLSRNGKLHKIFSGFKRIEWNINSPDKSVPLVGKESSDNIGNLIYRTDRIVKTRIPGNLNFKRIDINRGKMIAKNSNLGNFKICCRSKSYMSE